MAKQKKKLTANQQAFKKQQERIKKYLGKKKKEGYIIPDFQIPEMPKRVTQKALRTIKELTGRKLSKLLVKIPVLTSTKPQEVEIKKPKLEQNVNQIEVPVYAEIPLSADDNDWLIIQGFLDGVRDLPQLPAQKLMSLIQEYIAKYGEHETAIALEKMPSEPRQFLIRHGSDIDLEQFNTEFLQYLPTPTQKGILNEIEDLIEQINTGEYYV